jgi:hypothetical protein
VADVPVRAELLGFQGQVAIARGSMAGAIAQVLAALSAIAIGEMAGPVAAGVGGVASLVVMKVALNRARAHAIADGGPTNQ